MQHIDENTYIDDTLVTCAEYQLFIDEMREQGKYYQPDHWISYQFPDGQARKPILGVRYSDAIAFCEWLTQREAGEWNYRLPVNYETDSQLSIEQSLSISGYWIEMNRDGTNFVLIDDIQANPRIIKPTIYNDLEIQYKRDNKLDAVAKNVIEDWTFDISIIIDRILSRDLKVENDRITDIDNVMDRLLNPNFNKFHTNSIANLEKNRSKPVNINNMITVKSTFRNAINKISASTINNAVSLDLSYAIEAAPTIDQELYNFISIALDGGSIRLKEVIPVASLSQKLIIDIFTLRERIAGRSPAFEGIRLVKERIR